MTGMLTHNPRTGNTGIHASDYGLGTNPTCEWSLDDKCLTVTFEILNPDACKLALVARPANWPFHVEAGLTICETNAIAVFKLTPVQRDALSFMPHRLQNVGLVVCPQRKSSDSHR
jgi:hypothetical protein